MIEKDRETARERERESQTDRQTDSHTYGKRQKQQETDRAGFVLACRMIP